MEKCKFEFFSVFNYKNVLVSYIPFEEIKVILLSSLHGNTLEVITFHNTTKSRLETAYQMCASYNISRNIKYWLMVIFITMLNEIGFNTQIIYLGNQLELLRRRVSLKMWPMS